MAPSPNFALPAAEFSLFPFWFWNDHLEERELLRQMDDFQAHGVDAFVIHPRVGLPRSIGWMSDVLLDLMRTVIDDAARRGMKIILYDEGMYPSGSSSGQVVQRDPALACRGLECRAVALGVKADENVVATLSARDGRAFNIIDRRVDSYIRGLHHIGDGPAEDEPPAGDLLNPRTAETVIELVYQRFDEEFGRHFGTTILGIFTDEPHPLGKCRERNIRPGTTGILQHVNQTLGYDFAPHLLSLWLKDEPDAAIHARNYQRAIRRRMDQAWYRPLSEFCAARNIALCGHPAAGDDSATQRFFQFPGQDLVWRFVEPGKPSALEGAESTQAKVTSSAMIHHGRRRNSNEFCGAYGHETTLDEFKWLANWCLVRGVNLLIPHAFYYSTRGPRRDERPPDVGPNGAWWNQFTPFAHHCRRLCALNTELRHVCNVAIVADPDQAPWRAAGALFQAQIDFNYLDWITLLEKASISEDGTIRIAEANYEAIVIEEESLPAEVEAALSAVRVSNRLVQWCEGDPGFVQSVESITGRDVTPSAQCSGLRFRHLAGDESEHYYFFFNEQAEVIDCTIQLAVEGEMAWIDTSSGERRATEQPLKLSLSAHDVALLEIRQLKHRA